MSIIKAIQKAYDKAEQRRYDKIYYCIDVHDTIFTSNYQNGGYQFINEDVKECLQMFTWRPEIRLILWSSLIESEKVAIKYFLRENDILIDWINQNPVEQNTKYADFSEKFYFSVLIDDKAGFDPETDWKQILEWYKENNS